MPKAGPIRAQTKKRVGARRKGETKPKRQRQRKQAMKKRDDGGSRDLNSLDAESSANAIFFAERKGTERESRGAKRVMGPRESWGHRRVKGSIREMQRVGNEVVEGMTVLRRGEVRRKVK